MPQLTEFPYLPGGDPDAAVRKLIEVCRAIPAGGESYRSLRSRLRDRDLWERDRLAGFLKFFRLPGGASFERSPLLARIAEADPAGARELLADRLWEVNPVLFKTVIDRLIERVSPPQELYAFVDSFAYRGAPVPRRELESWVQLARGIGLIKRVGIALGAGDRAEEFAERLKKLDVDEYLEEDEPEPEPAQVDFTADAADSSDAPAATSAVVASAEAPAAAPEPIHTGLASTAVRQVAVELGSPRGHHPPIGVSRVVPAGRFDADVLAETTGRIETWWSDAAAGAAAVSPGDFGIDSERWMEGSEEALYRLAVAAAFCFRLPGDPRAIRQAYEVLEKARVLDDLYYGTAPEVLPAGVDPRALMLASLVARRCAEAPELAATLEKQSSAAEAFAQLDLALGRGLFQLELFWIMRALGDIGAARWDDLGNYAALPTRSVRDTLFRLGYLETPYAGDLQALAAASAAAREATGSASPADEVLGAFAVAAGCAYDCPHRRSCDFACRERLES